MPALHIKGTRLVAHDENGGASVRLLTNKEHPELVIRAWTQSDRYAAQGLLHPEVVTPVVTHVVDITPAAMTAIARSPSGVANGPDAILRYARKLREGSVTILAGVPRGNVHWDGSLDREWVIAGCDTRAEVIALVAIKDEPGDAVRARLGAARAIAAGGLEAKYVAPSIRLDSKNFELTLRRLIEAGEPLILIEFHGLTRGFSNLRIAHDWLRRAANPPYLVGVNVPRTVTRYGASGSLIAGLGGIQASAQAIPHGWFEGPGSDEDKLGRLKWFVQPEGGHVEAGHLPRGWLAGDTCPHADGHFATDLASAFDVRRVHETYAHVADAPLFARAISGETVVQDYVRSRRRLAGAVDELS